MPLFPELLLPPKKVQVFPELQLPQAKVPVSLEF